MKQLFHDQNMNVPNQTVPSFELCKALYDAGLRPPKEQSLGYAWAYDNSEFKADMFPNKGNIDNKGTRFEGRDFGKEYSKMILYFAPTAEQLLFCLMPNTPPKIPKKDIANFLAEKVLEMLKL